METERRRRRRRLAKPMYYCSAICLKRQSAKNCSSRKNKRVPFCRRLSPKCVMLNQESRMLYKKTRRCRICCTTNGMGHEVLQ
eukprot:11532_5